MEDILSALDDVSQETKPKKPEVFQESELGRVDYDNLKKVMKTTKLYAVKNTGPDLIVDWDLDLIPDDLRDTFDKYLSEKYNVYQIKESNLTFRLVVLYKDGRSINFLHQFMTEKKIPNLENVQEGPETMIRSQFVLPSGAVAIVTDRQYNSLKKFEKKRAVNKDGSAGSWDGTLVFKELDESNLKKVKHSFVTSQDVKNNEFEVVVKETSSRKGSANLEYSDELSEL